VSYKPLFRCFLEADPERLHFAAHSHHLWPDVTREAQIRCWDDAARLVDGKWSHIFAKIYPAAQRHVAAILKLPEPRSIVFGPNTHGFLLRLLSALPQDRPLRVLTTDSEFHSFTRQMARLSEEGRVDLHQIPAEPFGSFSERFAQAGGEGGWDLIYFSQVFYNSGFAIPDLPGLVDRLPTQNTMTVVDGYHGFLALPTDLSEISEQIFYISGGYKYAMAGEGAVFLHAPQSRAARPRDTGWYAAFGALESGARGEIPYGEDASRFLGATFDPSGIYRLVAVLDLLRDEDISVEEIHRHVRALQEKFADALEVLNLRALSLTQLMPLWSEESRGHFLTFRTDDAEKIHRLLWDANVITDYRGDRLRFGFGLYHDTKDIDALCKRLAAVLPP